MQTWSAGHQSFARRNSQPAALCACPARLGCRTANQIHRGRLFHGPRRGSSPAATMCTNSAQTSLANHHHLRNVANIDSRRTNSGSHSQRSLVIRRVVCPPHVRVCTKSVRPRYLPRISSQTVSQKDAGLRDTFLPTSATAPCGTEAGVRRRPLITNRSVPLRFHPTTATGTTGFLPAYGRSWVSRSTSA